MKTIDIVFIISMGLVALFGPVLAVLLVRQHICRQRLREKLSYLQGQASATSYRVESSQTTTPLPAPPPPSTRRD
jgi:hypothetical protein